MNEEDKLQVAVQVVEFAKNIHANPWGDFGRIAVVSFRQKDGGSHRPFYFKIVDQNHQPWQIDEEAFRNACVESHLAKQQLPTIFTL